MHESNERCEFPRDSKNLSTIIFSISERESGTYYGSEREDLVRDLKCCADSYLYRLMVAESFGS